MRSKHIVTGTLDRKGDAYAVIYFISTSFKSLIFIILAVCRCACGNGSSGEPASSDASLSMLLLSSASLIPLFEAGQINYTSWESWSKVFVYVLNGDNWTQQAFIENPPNFFIRDIAISGNTIVLSGDIGDDVGPTEDAAFVFTRSEGQWHQQTYMNL